MEIVDKYIEFRNDALKLYSEMPDELNELYKRYYLPIKLPDYSVVKTQEITSEKEVKELVNEIEKNTRIKFDLIFSDVYVNNMNKDNISIEKMEESIEILNNKIFKSKDNKLAAFVNAHAKKLIHIKIKKGERKNLNLLFVNNSDIIFQLVIDIEEGAELSVTELFVSTNKIDSTVAQLQEFRVMQNSKLEVNFINNCNEKTAMLNLSKCQVNTNARFTGNFVYNGASFTKSINYFDAKENKSNIDVTEMIYGTGLQKFDINTYMVNMKEHTNTHLETGAVLDGSSNCVLKGYAKVDKWTRGAISRVNERGILISEKAHIDALPDMSIDYSEEVSATHSAATAPIDKDALFYMMSRGISEQKSRKMFISSFILSYLSNIKNPFARELASSILLGRIENDVFGLINDVSTLGVWLAEKSDVIV